MSEVMVRKIMEKPVWRLRCALTLSSLCFSLPDLSLYWTLKACTASGCAGLTVSPSTRSCVSSILSCWLLTGLACTAPLLTGFPSSMDWPPRPARAAHQPAATAPLPPAAHSAARPQPLLHFYCYHNSKQQMWRGMEFKCKIQCFYGFDHFSLVDDQSLGSFTSLSIFTQKGKPRHPFYNWKIKKLFNNIRKTRTERLLMSPHQIHLLKWTVIYEQLIYCEKHT